MKIALVLGAITMLCGGCATGQLSSTCPVYWEPPSQYDHDPDPYPVIRLVGMWDVNAACDAPTGYYAGGGTATDGTSRNYGCFRYIDPPLKVPEVIAPLVNANEGVNDYCQQQIVRHEFGHANGWPSSHPGAVKAE